MIKAPAYMIILDWANLMRRTDEFDGYLTTGFFIDTLQ